MKTLSTFLVWTIVASFAHAGLIESNDPSYPSSPDGFNITLDTVTGLRWLDVPVTSGASFNSVVGRTGPGGDLTGFRYATRTEVENLMTGLGLTINGGGPADVAPAEEFMRLLGITEMVGSEPVTTGLFDDSDVGSDPARVGFGRVNVMLLFADPFPPELVGGTDFANDIISMNSALGSRGSFLVQAIPEPSATSMLTLVAIGVLARRRRFGKAFPLRAS